MIAPASANATGNELARQVLHALDEAVLACDLQGRLTLANAAAMRLLRARPGASAFALHGLPLSQFLPELAARGVAERAAAGETRFETDAVGFGHRVSVSVRVSPMGQDEGWVLMLRATEEQAGALEALRLFKRATAASQQGVVISDMTAPGEPIVYVNEAFLWMTGHSAHEVLGRKCSFLQHTDKDQDAIDEIRRALAAERSVTVLLRNYRKDGSLFWNELNLAPVHDERGRLTHYVGTQNDVSGRIAAEQAARRHTRQMDAIMELAPDGYVLVDASRRVVYVNPAFERMTGLSGREVCGRLDMDGLEAALRARAAPDEPWPDFVLADSTAADVLVLARPRPTIMARVVRLGVGDDHHTILQFRDITREHEVERMKSEFLAMAAHELRTPMASILGYSELMLHREYPPAKQKAMLETVHRQSSLMVRLLSELLDLARIEARAGRDFQMSAQPVAPLLETLAADFVVTGDARRVHWIAPARADALAAIDADKTRQAVSNLLANAFKYSAEPAPVRLEMIDSPDDGPIGIRVTDAGIGMTPEQCERAFDRFYRADTSGHLPGAGLGLSIVKEIVSIQGGEVRLFSTPGQGTEITLWLPRARAALPRTAGSASALA